MKKTTTTLSIALFCLLTVITSVAAQNDIRNPFNRSKIQNNRSDYGINGPKQFLTLSEVFTNKILSQRTETIEMTLPLTERKNLNLQLSEFKFLSKDFVLRDSRDREITPTHLGKFYKGVVAGYPESVVVMNIFDNEISATLDLGDKTYSLTKIKRSKEYILYEEKDIVQEPTLACFSDNLKSKITTDLDQNAERMPPNPDNCVKMYIELDHDLFNAFGDVTETYNYFAGAFSQVVILYSNEQVNMTLSEVKVWDTVDPYTGPSTGNFLDQFMAEVGSGFNGDLAHLVGNSGNGGIAYVGVLCNKANGFGYSGISTSYSNVPAYSWTVNVLTHEIGHNLGSPHTHACVWNGNDTQIDDCGNKYLAGLNNPDFPPNDCYDAATETIPNKGTIMSYCHLSTGNGMDFNLGFGPQPGDLIRSRVYNASCLGPCEECLEEGDLCDDGDPCTTNDAIDLFCNCTGTSLPDLDGDGVCASLDPDDDDICVPNPCDDCTLTTISITVDAYPQETSWVIRNDNGETVASANGFTSSTSPQTREVCLDDGCYDFIIYDTYGDGICCGFGNGSYSVTDAEGNIVASGGQFGSSQTTNFCYSNHTACTDDDEDDICNDVDPCYDPMVVNMEEALQSGTYNARQEIILGLGTTIPENAVIQFNAPSVKIMDDTNIPASATITINEVPCEN